MSITGKNGIFYSKKDLQSQKTPAIGFKKIKAMHEAVAGDTIIDLNALTLPSITPGFVNPSASDIAAARLIFNEKNLTVVSSLSGVLDWDSYSIPSNTTIRLKEAAEDKELFSIVIDPVVKTGLKTVDANPVVVTGELAIAATEFIVGSPFDVNKYNTQQQGSILVFLDGQLVARNVANAVNAPGADGDYHEVDNGGGIGTIIRFNNSSGSVRSVMVISNGLAFTSPDDSYQAVTESIASQVDAMIPTLAALAGVPTTDFQSGANYQDLAAFGNRMLVIETNFNLLLQKLERKQ